MSMKSLSRAFPLCLFGAACAISSTSASPQPDLSSGSQAEAPVAPVRPLPHEEPDPGASDTAESPPDSPPVVGRFSDERYVAALAELTSCVRRHPQRGRSSLTVQFGKTRGAASLAVDERALEWVSGNPNALDVPAELSECFRRRFAESDPGGQAGEVRALINYASLRLTLSTAQLEGGTIKPDVKKGWTRGGLGVNEVAGDASWVAGHARAPGPQDNYDERIKTHLEWVIDRLESSPPAGLDGAQRDARAESLGHLRSYASAGRFPQHETFLGQRASTRPRFIDHAQVHCAVGELLRASGYGTLAASINRRHEYAYVPDIDEPELFAWADARGFTPDELALIQPNYWTPPALPPLDALPRGFRMRPDHFRGAGLVSRDEVAACQAETEDGRTWKGTLTLGWDRKGSIVAVEGAPEVVAACIERRFARAVDPYFHPRYHPGASPKKLQGELDVLPGGASFALPLPTRKEMEKRTAPIAEATVREYCPTIKNKITARLLIQAHRTEETPRFQLSYSESGRARGSRTCIGGHHEDVSEQFRDRSGGVHNINHPVRTWNPELD